MGSPRLEKAKRSAARVITGIKKTDRVSNGVLLARAGFDRLSRHRNSKVPCTPFAAKLCQKTPEEKTIHSIEAFS